MANLAEVASGKTVRIVGIEPGFNCQKKLQDLGLREGITVKKLRGLFRRGPVIVKIGQAQIALGRGMAEKVIVEAVE
ncbi:MAG: ferrous iron transport protein A [Candidatus Omnitrophica bacterium]|nr:ferrous iron transport protein A [Candidatus Omnitrophota bacterium]